MKSYYEHLWDNIDVIIKQSNDRRKQLDDFINAISRRIQIEETYAKNIQIVAKLFDKYIKQKGSMSMTYSAFKSNSIHRAQQSKIFAQSLRDEVLVMLKQTINLQNTQCKKLEKEARKWDKDLINELENFNRAKSKFLMTQKEKQQQLVLNQIAKISNELITQKKQKQNIKTKQLEKQAKEFEGAYKLAIKQYNQFIQNYNSDMKKILDKYQQQQIKRAEKQIDAIMKILIFQTAMMRNFDYDISLISSQMEKIKAEDDVISFIQQFSNQRANLKPHTLQPNPSLFSNSLNKIITKQLDKKMQFEKNKEIKNFIEKKYKQQQINNMSDIKPEDLQSYNKVFDLVSSCWKSADITAQNFDTFRELIQYQNNRHIFLLAFRHYGSMSNLQLSVKSYFSAGNMLQILIQKCIQKKDVFIIRKLVNLLFSYWSSRDNQQTQYTQQPQNNKEKVPQQKILLYLKLINLSIWKSNDYWQAAIFESIHEQLKIAAAKKGQTINQSITRQKNIVLSQLASFCHNMIMLGINPKTVRQIIGKYCRWYDLSEESNKNLSKTIINIHKQYKQVYGGQSSIQPQERKQRDKQQFRPMMI